jgi:hypothetical protein
MSGNPLPDQFKDLKTRQGSAFVVSKKGSTVDVQLLPPSKAHEVKKLVRAAPLAVGGTFGMEDGKVAFHVSAKKGKLPINQVLTLSVKNLLQISTAPTFVEDAGCEDLTDEPVGPTGDGGGDLDALDSGLDALEGELGGGDLQALDSGLDLLDGGGDPGGDLGGLDVLGEGPPGLLIEKNGKKNIQEEWDRIDQMKGPRPEGHPEDGQVPSVLHRATQHSKTVTEKKDGTVTHKTVQIGNDGETGEQMFHVRDGVHAPLNWEDVSQGKLGEAQERLAFERKATSWLRGSLTKSANQREDKAKESVQKNSDMATGLAGILEKHPELLGKDGLFSRIVGPVTGQGQYKSGTPVKDIVEKVTGAAQRVKEGKGEGEDHNLVLQFIGCFTDGLTEVIENKEVAKTQMEAIWPDFCDAFGVAEEDREALFKKLKARVENYKAIAGGRSDTLTGKGSRKDLTREGINPSDPRLRINEHEALIKGDVSGSVHSCFLAYELAESLQNPMGIDEEKDVVLTDRGLIDARVLDALSMTAGGKFDQGKVLKENPGDGVFHTAWEMLNGMRGITGVTEMLTQDQATKVIELMWKGKGYTQAMKTVLPDAEFGWT